MNPEKNNDHKPFPWYDSPWLDAYVQAKAIIRKVYPGRLEEFERAMDRLKAPTDFQVQELADVFDTPTLIHVKRVIAELKEEQMERHELFGFGREIVHDHPEFGKIQRSLTDTVSALVGEAVQPSYNFLSLYNNLGICHAHMDAPTAKWTLDICIEQSEPWPIYFSQWVTWPEDFEQTQDDWHEQIVNDPALHFQSYTLQENNAIAFCGSNQWHYRDRIFRNHQRNFCHLLFLHYVPFGCDELLKPGRWHQLFDIPELKLLKDVDYV